MFFLIFLLSCGRVVDLKFKEKIKPDFKTMEIEEDELIAIRNLKESLSKNEDINKLNKDGITMLMAVSFRNHTTVLNMLLDNGALINKAASNGLNALFVTIESDSKEAFKILLDRGSAIESLCDGDTPLLAAAKKGNSYMVQELLERKANINRKTLDAIGSNALMYASEFGHEEVVRVLLDRGAVVDAERSKKVTALMLASYNGHVNIVRMLIEKGAEVDKADIGGYTSLLTAARYGKTEVVEMLLKSGADVNKQTQIDGDSALFVSSYRGYIDVVRILLSNGAEPNIKKIDGITPIFSASQNGRLDIVNLLLDNGALVNSSRKDGITALMVAVKMGHVNATEALLERGAEVDKISPSGPSALALSIEARHKNIFEMLLNKIADVNKRLDINGLTPLMLACDKNLEDYVDILLEKNAEVNLVDNNGKTALFYASESESISKKLIDRGADINLIDKDGNTALHSACAKNCKAVVKMLLEKGASETKNNVELTPVMVAEVLNHKEIIDIFKSRKKTIKKDKLNIPKRKNKFHVSVDRRKRVKVFGKGKK